jgi:hypothetical protein
MAPATVAIVGAPPSCIDSTVRGQKPILSDAKTADSHSRDK